MTETEILLERLAAQRAEIAYNETRVEKSREYEKDTISMLPAELFPQGSNSYSCKPCQEGRHGDCEKRIYAGQGSSWSADCTCYSTTKDFHAGG